jgi:hypothetical protein
MIIWSDKAARTDVKKLRRATARRENKPCEQKGGEQRFHGRH